MAVVILDHLDGSAHLLSKRIHVHPFHQAEGGKGVPEAVSAASLAGGTHEQSRFRQDVLDHPGIKLLCRITLDGGEHKVVRPRRFADGADTLEVVGDMFRRHQIA